MLGKEESKEEEKTRSIKRSKINPNDRNWRKSEEKEGRRCKVDVKMKIIHKRKLKNKIKRDLKYEMRKMRSRR